MPTYSVGNESGVGLMNELLHMLLRLIVLHCTVANRVFVSLTYIITLVGYANALFQYRIVRFLCFFPGCYCSADVNHIILINFGVGVEEARPEGPRSGDGVLGEGTAAPPHQLGGLRERCT